MRVRITTIALDHDGVLFPEGAIVEAGVDLPAEIVEARLASGRAEIVGDEDQLGDHLRAAFEAYQGSLAAIRAPLLNLLDLVERTGITAARAFVDLMEANAAPEIGQRVRAIHASVEDADREAWMALQQQISSTEGSPAQVVDEAGNSAPASEDAAGDGSAASEVLNAVEPTDEETTAAPSAVVEPAAADASTDSPPTTDPVATAEPAAVAEATEGDPPKVKAKAKAKAAGNSAGGN